MLIEKLVASLSNEERIEMLTILLKDTTPTIDGKPAEYNGYGGHANSRQMMLDVSLGEQK